MVDRGEDQPRVLSGQVSDTRTGIANEVVYAKDGVFVHMDAGSRQTVSGGGGTLKITEACYGAVIEWLPTSETEYHVMSENGGNEQDWAVISTSVGYKVDKSSGNDAVELKSSRRSLPFVCEVADLKSFKMSSADNTWAHITLMQKDGTTHPTLHFHSGGIDGFLETLNKYVVIRDSKEPGLFLVTDPKVAALQKSLNELELFKDHTEDAVTKFFRNPYSATLTGFSKVTNLVFDYVTHGVNPPSRSENEMLEIISSNLSMLDINQHEEPDFEVIGRDELGIRPEVTRGPPLTPELWSSSFNAEGQIVNVAVLKDIIFRGGMMHVLRSDVWKYLLNYYSFDSTSKSRLGVKKKKTDDYFRMKLQWKTISDEQEKRFSDLRDRRSLVEKDVNRTDRTDPYFAGEGNENVQLLHDILMTYCMYNFDLGYVQGMSDLLSPILIVMQNEVDAFWCFAGFMEKVCSNFEMDQQGIKTQLQHLHTLISYLDPEFTAYLDSRESGNLYFCFRWLLILFKREFRFQEIMRLWEVLWTDLPCKNFHLLLCLAILDNEKKTVMESQFGFTEILKHMNDMSYDIPLEDTLCRAEAIYLQIKESKKTAVREILGLPPIPTDPVALLENQSSSSSSTNGDTEQQCQQGLNLHYL